MKNSLKLKIGIDFDDVAADSMAIMKYLGVVPPKEMAVREEEKKKKMEEKEARRKEKLAMKQKARNK
jgi:hypothetical protein